MQSVSFFFVLSSIATVLLLLFFLPFFTLLFLPYSLSAAMRVLITLLLCVQYIYIAFRHYATAVLFC